MAGRRMPTADNARSVGRPSQGQAPVKKAVTRLFRGPSAPNWKQVGGVGKGRSKIS